MHDLWSAGQSFQAIMPTLSDMLGWLQNLQSEPQRLALVRADEPDNWNNETPEAVQEAFRTYLTDDKALHVRLTAEQVGQ